MSDDDFLYSIIDREIIYDMDISLKNREVSKEDLFLFHHSLDDYYHYYVSDDEILDNLSSELNCKCGDFDECKFCILNCY